MTFFASVALSIVAISADSPARAADRHDAIAVQITSDKPITLTADELSKLGRVKIQTGKDKDQRTYEGVPLANILRAAGMTWGTKCSLWLDCYVIVEGADGFRVVFSIPEIDPGLAHQTVFLADHCDGNPLSKTVGPYQLVEEGARQRGRWVRQVTAIQVRMASDE